MSPPWYVPPGLFRRGDVLVDLLVASPYPPTSSQRNLIPSMVQHNGANWILASLQANVASAQRCYKGYGFLSCGHVDEGSCRRKWEEQREKQPWCSSSREWRNGAAGGWTSSDGGDGLVCVSWGGFFLPFCSLYFLPHFLMEDLNIFWGESIRSRKKEKAKEWLGSDGPKQPAKVAFIIKLPWPRHQGSWGCWWLPWLCGGSSETESFREKGRTCGEGEGLQREGRGCPQGNVPAVV